MISKEEAFRQVKKLVQRFGEQIDSYKSGDYNETLTRQDFINPFFKALGWDVDNSQAYAEAYREVIHEDKVKIGKATKAPDYSFRLGGGKRLFFVEAKKPSVYVKEDISVAYQVRRYGWSAKLAISIVTDFEEFAVYDCTKKPNSTDKPAVARIKYLTFDKYLDEFDFLWDTFSKEHVLKGSFDQYVKSDTVKKGTATVDKEFLSSLDKWRTYLATSISLNNKTLDEDEINFAVQQTIDRLIFLRIAEDRGVEAYGQLKVAVNLKGDTYQNLFFNFKKADEKYNSGIFDFKKDVISENLVIDNKVIKTIVNEMYYPECPYEFSVLSVEILGSAYEQFLGKVIRITPAHHAKIEDKPEVRKAGGVYYTPQYVVDYIVKNTVGKLVEGKTPKQVEKIKICDPACGSGSFLIGAYQYLLDFHKNYYTENGRKTGKKDSPVTPEGNLTSTEKKRILLNNIYGVDIDVNAVEVTKLSLLLKCMEGETETTIAQQYKLWHERILPTLDNNIKSGNSLIDTDYYDGIIDFDKQSQKAIKPFNWQRAFPEVFKLRASSAKDDLKLQFKRVEDTYKKGKELNEKYLNLNEPKASYGFDGGFDVVISNPPYVRQELLGIQKKYFENKYRVYHGMADLYSYFIERSFQLLNNNGLYGVIVANKWMRSNYGEPLREYLVKQTLEQIIDFGDQPVFESATTYPCILIAYKGMEAKNKIEVTNVKTLNFTSLDNYILLNKQTIKQNALKIQGWNLAGEVENNLLEKINKAGVPLGEYVKGKIFRGVLTGLNEAFVIDQEVKDRLITEDPRSKEIIKPFLAGRDIKRYQKPESNKYLIFTKRGVEINKYPAILKHLEQYKKQLTPKPKDWKGETWEGRKPGAYKWYEIQDAVDYYAEFEKTKIIYPNILSKPEFVYDENHWYTNQKCFIISMPDKYLLGILNSSLNNYLFEKYLPKLRGGFYEPSYVFFKNFPIVNNPTTNKKEEIIGFVEQILTLKEQIKTTKLPNKIEQLKSQIDHIDNKINQLVYQLYGLTEEEIKIVEGGK
jgi:adenine-specific DNA-methyltransferase